LLDLPRVSRDSVRSDFERISVHFPVTPQFEPTTETDDIADAASAWDFRRLITVGSNVLIRGEKSAATATVVALSADLSIPLVTWSAGSHVSLPALHQGTVVLQDVDRLDLSGQRELLAWLDDRGGRVRVISTARGDLFDLVMSGEFLDPLYYRLNTIVVDAAAMDGCVAQ
jgi:sigma-54-interacting transcriptional regulator